MAVSSSPSARQASPTSSRTRAHLVRRVELLPGVARAAQRAERGARVAVGEADRAHGVRDGRVQHAARHRLREPLELLARARRRLDVAGREHDLDLGGQQPGAGERVRRSRRRRGGSPRPPRRAPLRQPQQRQPRLRLDALPARLAVRLLGGGEVALQAVQLPLAVERLAGGPRSSATTRAGLPRLGERLGPGAAHLHDLGAVDEAAAGERDEVLLLLAPARQRGGPLLRAAQLVELLAAVDHAAVDEAGGDRRQLAGE